MSSEILRQVIIVSYSPGHGITTCEPPSDVPTAKKAEEALTIASGLTSRITGMGGET